MFQDGFNWWLIITLITLIIRLLVIALHRKCYARPFVLCIFATVKFTSDYFLFDGVSRFSPFNESINFKLLLCIELCHVILTNYMIYSIFYADFVLPSKAIIFFTVVNFILAIIAFSLIFTFENNILNVAVVVLLHVFGFFSYLDKCCGLLNSGIFNKTGLLLIYISILFKIVFDHFLRVLYLLNLFINILDSPVPLNKLFFIVQLISTFLIISMFILYRRHNSENVCLVFVYSHKDNSAKGPDSEFVFENAAEELMFPAENELNTISETSSEDYCDLGPDLEELDQQEAAPEVFATVESGRSRRTEPRINILRRPANKVASEPC